MGRGRDGTIKHDTWVFRTKTGKYEVEIRLAVEGNVHFIAEMPGGGKITGTDLNQLRWDVEDAFLGLETAEWEKIIEISVDKEYRHQEDAASVGFSWRVYWQTEQSDGRRFVKYAEDGPIDHPYTRSEHERVIPYTEDAEAFLNAAAESIRALRRKLESFFWADDLEQKIARGVNLLPAPGPDHKGVEIEEKP